MFDSVFLNCLNYFDGMMGSLATVTMKLAWIIALVGILWSCIQLCFGTLEVRKFVGGTIMKFFLFGLIISVYPAFCWGLRTFSMQLGLEARTEKDGVSLDSVFTKQIKTQQRVAEILENKANQAGNSKSARKEAEKNNAEAAKARKKAETLEEYASRYVNPETGEETYHVNLFMDEGEHKWNAASSSSLISMDSLFHVNLLMCDILRENEYYGDVMTSWNPDLEKRVDGLDEADRQAGIISAVETGKARLSLLNIPVAAFFRFIMVMVCCMFDIGLTCVTMIQYIMCICEYSIVSSFSLLLIPCMLFDGLKDMAQKIIGMLFAQAVKLAMIIMSMMFSMVLFAQMSNAILSDTSQFGFIQCGTMIFICLLAAALTSNAPKLASVVVTGQPQMSMGEFVGTAAAVGGGAVAGAVLAGKAGRWAVQQTAGRAVTANAQKKMVRRAGDSAYSDAIMNGASETDAKKASKDAMRSARGQVWADKAKTMVSSHRQREAQANYNSGRTAAGNVIAGAGSAGKGKKGGDRKGDRGKDGKKGGEDK